MQISATLPSMTAAPSNVKNREIHKGGYPTILRGFIEKLIYSILLVMETADSVKYGL
jgi:hypothetical protein